MTITTISSPAFVQDPSAAVCATQTGPVLIVDQGGPTHVLLTIEQYRRLAGEPVDNRNIADLLAMPEGKHIEFEVPRLPDDFTKPVDFSG
jgi:PHD/YefM family antitoxin component YafN of YafNO toxin-antitoxin module